MLTDPELKIIGQIEKLLQDLRMGRERVCPHCGKTFIAPRRDRVYCTARLQRLHSKRNYASKKAGHGPAAAIAEVRPFKQRVKP